jgi:hypothetical protein
MNAPGLRRFHPTTLREPARRGPLMSVLTRRGAAAVFTALTVTVVTACSHSGPTATSPAPPTQATQSPATPITTASGTAIDTTAPLTDTETLWLASFNRMEMTLSNSLNKAPQNLTPSSMLTMADALRGCGRTLTRLGPPSQRLQPVYQPAQQECAAYDRAAQCLDTVAAMGNTTVGSPEERKFSQAMDCVSAGMRDGGVAMTSAMKKSTEIRAASGDL